MLTAKEVEGNPDRLTAEEILSGKEAKEKDTDPTTEWVKTGYDILNSDVTRVLADDGQITITGIYSNISFRRILKMTDEQLAEYGYTRDYQGPAEESYMSMRGNTTQGDPVKGEIKEILLQKQESK